MILTPTIPIDSNHLASFRKEVEEFDREPSKKHEKFYGTGELHNMTIEVKHVNLLQGNGMLLLVTDNDGTPIVVSRLISAPIPQGAFPWSRKVYVMDRIRVHKNYIGNGIAPGLYRWLASHGHTIISDSHQTQTSLAVWRKLATKCNVYTVNLNDGNWRAYDPLKIEDWMLFGNGDPGKYWPIRFVLPGN